MKDALHLLTDQGYSVSYRCAEASIIAAGDISVMYTLPVQIWKTASPGHNIRRNLL